MNVRQVFECGYYRCPNFDVYSALDIVLYIVHLFPSQIHSRILCPKTILCGIRLSS